MYLDVALYVKHKDDSLHWQAIVGEFTALHLEGFFHTVMNACRVWFGTETICPLPEPDTETLDRLLSYTLDSDLFGHSRDHAVIELRNEKDEAPSRSSVLRKMLFPPATEIESRYAFCKPPLASAAGVARAAVCQSAPDSKPDSPDEAGHENGQSQRRNL